MTIPTDLRTALEYQKSFMEKELARLYPKGFDLTTVHHGLCTHIVEEAMELLACEPWHFHKKPAKATRYTMITEAVDVFKWLLNVMIVHNIQHDEFLRVFCEKSAVVENRVATEVFVKSNPGPCLILDLDGVLCDRDSALLEFAKTPALTVKEFKASIGQKQYERVKRAFFDSDNFASCKPKKAEIEMLNSCRGDVPVVILTARDVKTHARCHFVTIEWLHTHGIAYDALICYPEKDRALAGWCSHDSIAIDDEQEQIERMMHVCDAHRYFSSPLLIRTSLETLKERRNASESRRPNPAVSVPQPKG